MIRRRVLLVLLASLSLAACAGAGLDRAPACHGPRRPANPLGSVLAPEAVTPPAPIAGPAGAGCWSSAP